MFKKRNYLLLAVLSLSLAIVQGFSLTTQTIGLLPIINNTENPGAAHLLEEKIETRLEKIGYRITPSRDLRDILRKHRIRNLGQMMKFSSKFLSTDFNLKWIGVPSIDVYESKGVPEISLSFRIVKIETMEVLWANAISLSGQDRGWFFELGTIEKTEDLVENALQTLFKNMPPEIIEKEKFHNEIKISLVPFDNLTPRKASNYLVENILISSLKQDSINVIEPGALQYFFNLNQQSPVGEIELLTLKELKQFFKLDYVITGTIDVLEHGGADFKYLNPKIELTLKLLNCKTAKIDGIWHIYETGDSSIDIFQLGKEISIGRLIQKNFKKDLINKIKDQVLTKG